MTRSIRPAGHAAAGVPAAALIAVAATLLVATGAGAGEPPFPSPLSGPGVADLKRSDLRKLDRAWSELVDGDLERSARHRSRARASAPAELLGLQLELVRGNGVVEPLTALCTEHPNYAAAWITLSVAAERAGDEVVSLDAARAAAELWPKPRWSTRAAELEARWVDDRLAAAETASFAGRHDEALALIEAARVHAPDDPRPLLIEAEVLYNAGRLDESEAVLRQIADLPTALALIGRIAEDRRDWQAAMEAYSALPESDPVRTAALERVQIRWRMTMLPAYARRAMTSTELTRGELAVVLVSIRPRLETLPGGPVPVMSDIVDHPGQREIITVVRLGLMSADEISHQFYPDRPVGTDGVREVVARTRAVLGLEPVVWCREPDVLVSGCTPISSPPGGGDVVNAVLDTVSEAEP